MSNPVVTINLVVLNGRKYIHHCLEAVLSQSYPHEFIEFNILDNGSLDNTKEIIENLKFKILNSKFKFNLIESKLNLGVWPGQEELLKHSNSKYVLGLCVDVLLDKDFIKNAVEAMEKDARIGALEAKIYKYDLESDQATSDKRQVKLTNIIDTCGFEIYRSRRITNIGHGKTWEELIMEKPSFAKATEGKEIFGVEGAAPFFRREAIEDIRIDGEFCDHDYFWYGDDLDLAWRINLLGWKQIFAPSVIAWHDRQTTKKLSSSFADFRAIRRALPLKKRRLEWKNIRFTIIKNDYIINILRDLPYILKRELVMLGYLVIFEPKVLLEIPNFLRLFPIMLRKRKEIMKKTKVSPREIHKFFR